MEGFFFFLLFFLAGKACRSKRAQVSEQMIPVAVHRPKKRKKEKRGKKEKKGKERKKKRKEKRKEKEKKEKEGEKKKKGRNKKGRASCGAREKKRKVRVRVCISERWPGTVKGRQKKNGHSPPGIIRMQIDTRQIQPARRLIAGRGA